MQEASGSGYGGVARAFHWLTAFLIIALFALGWYMADLEFADPEKFRLYQIHKSIGITVFLLAVLRLVWRLTHRAPPWPEHMSAWERVAAAGAHWALYGLILLQPVIGILQSNAANFPIVFWGGYELPALIAPSEMLGDLLLNAHHLVGNALAGLVLLHVAAALRHHIQLKDDVLRNMMPSARIGSAVAVLALALIVPPFLLTETSEPQATAASTETEVLAPATDTAAPAEVSGEAWAIEEGSRLGFVALQQGSEVLGNFDAFDAEVVFDPDDLDNSRIGVDIDVTSITTGHSDRDKTLNSPSFFDTATWPAAAFKSETITATGEDRYDAAGTLTIRDVTKDVVLSFSLDIQADSDDPSRERAEAKGELPILRLDFGVGQGDWTSTTTVADEVVITIDIKASKPTASNQPSG
ncbi:MAG: cytochrome b/b6 domain-containing protein [Geminicoccaceae bacterium]